MGALLLALCQQMAAKAHTGVTIANFAAPGHWRGNHPRKDGRVVECAGLEIRFRGLPLTRVRIPLFPPISGRFFAAPFPDTQTLFPGKRLTGTCGLIPPELIDFPVFHFLVCLYVSVVQTTGSLGCAGNYGFSGGCQVMPRLMMKNWPDDPDCLYRPVPRVACFSFSSGLIK